MNPLRFIWFWVLPVLGIIGNFFWIIFWVFVVPPLARRLTKARFQNVSLHAVHHDSGTVDIVPTKEKLPEGIERTKHGWHFLPRPSWKQREPTPAEKLALRKYTLLGSGGKPLWIDYAGKITSMNAGTLAGMQQTQSNPDNPSVHFTKISEYLASLPKPFKGIRKDLTKMLEDLQSNVKAEPVTLIDPDEIKQAVEEMYPPSTIDALAINREMKGMQRAGRQFMPLILAVGVIGIIIVAIIALTMFLG